MSEIKTEIKRNTDGSYTITDAHSTADILRWLLTQDDKETILYLLGKTQKTKVVAPTKRVFQEWLENPLTKALKQSHQTEVDAIVKDSDRAFELLRRAEVEMRYAGWTKYENDNNARNGVYEEIKQFLEKP